MISNYPNTAPQDGGATEGNSDGGSRPTEPPIIDTVDGDSFESSSDYYKYANNTCLTHNTTFKGCVKRVFYGDTYTHYISDRWRFSNCKISKNS